MLKILKCKYMGHWSSHLILIFWVSQWITVKIPYIKWQYRNLQTSWSWGKVRNAVGSRLPTWVSPDCSIPRSSHSPIWILSSSPSGIEPRNFSSVPDITRKRSVRIVSLRCIYTCFCRLRRRYLSMWFRLDDGFRDSGLKEMVFGGCLAKPWSSLVKGESTGCHMTSLFNKKMGYFVNQNCIF